MMVTNAARNTARHNTQHRGTPHCTAADSRRAPPHSGYSQLLATEGQLAQAAQLLAPQQCIHAVNEHAIVACAAVHPDYPCFLNSPLNSPDLTSLFYSPSLHYPSHLQTSPTEWSPQYRNAQLILN